ncbi:flagellar basal-body MS-ring/collar protein FliF [Helicobacter sp. MIT 14-3879]|uniref:flagellar basal-body MS-ring/collar protein FliF n=1 Tax=Helicobacter sp. MIT 14-3879 TaxID=2040649 RepID=UPI000E1EC445|nr:flagellar basal-body MS-ring/collar protein FliF [Helicobacter sp. MIT 14-3879]RDU62269.1 flagellar M-ring protein FliF [Helicobacter sp. MIT 14-3879]
MDINKLFRQLLDLYNKLNKRQKIAVIGGIVAVIAFLSFFIVFSIKERSVNSNYAVLFEGLSPSDNALVVQHLKTNNIAYKIPKEDTILVPKDVVYEQRIELSSNGIPKNSKVGFEIFDEQTFGITEFEQKVKLTRAIEGELSRTIESLKPISKASVHIALPEESVFVSKEVLPTASAVLEIRPNMYLSPNQIDGIKNLISSSVAKLTKENVSIIDQNGEALGSDSESLASRELINLQLKYKNNYEKILEDKIINVLTPIIGGKDRVVAKVSAEFDFSQTKSMQETFDPNNVVRSEQNHEERKEGVSEPEIGGVPGAVSNIGPVQGLDSLTNNQIHTINTTTTNYEVGKTVSEIKGAFGVLKRLSAAVVVDGSYDLVNNNGVEKLQYIPIEEAKMTQIDSLVKQAIGFSQNRGDEVSVSNFEFNAKSGTFKPQTTMEKISTMLQPLIPFFKYILVGIIIFIFYKKIIVPFAERMIETAESKEEDVESLLTIDDDEEYSNRENELRKRIEDQLGLGNFNEDNLKYDVLLEKIKTLISEKPQEISGLFQMLIRDELGLEEVKKGE